MYRHTNAYNIVTIRYYKGGHTYNPGNREIAMILCPEGGAFEPKKTRARSIRLVLYDIIMRELCTPHVYAFNIHIYIITIMYFYCGYVRGRCSYIQLVFRRRTHRITTHLQTLSIYFIPPILPTMAPNHLLIVYNILFFIYIIYYT